jgi:SAM-dependent methyltransferase
MGTQLMSKSTHPWERFARTDPHWYIFTTKNSGPHAFWQSGEQVVEDEILPLIKQQGVQRLLALELGCGIGRLTLPLARHFQRVAGIDISEGMVQRAISSANHKGISNASFVHVTGPADIRQRAASYLGICDFVYSLLVFQHIPDFVMIQDYLFAVRTLLRRDGLAYLQFDTRPKNLGYHLKINLPDFLLPRTWRKDIRRIRRATPETEVAIRRAGLKIVAECAPQTEYHRYVLRLDQNL